MKERIYADTNLFIRYFTNDPPKQAEQSRKLLEKVAGGVFELFICDVVIAEIIYVLESVYNLDKKEIVQEILAISQFENIVIENQTIILEALGLYLQKNLDFTDAYLTSHLKKTGHKKVATFDDDFKKVGFLERFNFTKFPKRKTREKWR